MNTGYPAVFDPCRKCGAMAWQRAPDVVRIAIRAEGSDSFLTSPDDDVIERWNCPCGNFLTWGHPKAKETA